MRLLKKNQVIIYVIVLMLMAVAYLNYTTQTGEQAVEASMQMEARDDTNTSNIGDATLVSSNDVSVDNNTAMLENVVSRKKQMLPPILNALNNDVNL